MIVSLAERDGLTGRAAGATETVRCGSLRDRERLMGRRRGARERENRAWTERNRIAEAFVCSVAEQTITRFLSRYV